VNEGEESYRGVNQTTARIAIVLIWLIILMPVYSADALEISFSTTNGVTPTQNSVKIEWNTDENSEGSGVAAE